MLSEKTAERILYLLAFLLVASIMGFTMVPESLVSLRTGNIIILSIGGLAILAIINVICVKRGTEKKQLLISLGLTLMYILWKATSK